MDLDAYVVANVGRWQRLEELTGRRRLTGAEADEMMELYQQTATHLSVIRTSAPDAQVVTYLSVVLARVRTRSVGAYTTTWRGFVAFFTRRFPAQLYRQRWWWVGCLLVNVVVVACLMVWLAHNPQVEQTLLTPAEIDALVEDEFADYYSTYAASNFALQVWINNAWVAAQCLAFGVLGFPIVYVLWTNVLNLAVIGSIMTRHGQAGEFWGLILPHGLLELTAVFVAAGVGLRLFWSWVEPGGLTRAQSLAREGRSAGTVALGLVVVLAISGIIEAFVTPSPLPTWARVGIGIAAELLFFAYVFVLGRRAHLLGHTGDLGPDLLEDRLPARA